MHSLALVGDVDDAVEALPETGPQCRNVSGRIHPRPSGPSKQQGGLLALVKTVHKDSDGPIRVNCNTLKNDKNVEGVELRKKVLELRKKGLSFACIARY